MLPKALIQWLPMKLLSSGYTTSDSQKAVVTPSNPTMYNLCPSPQPETMMLPSLAHCANQYHPSAPQESRRQGKKFALTLWPLPQRKSEVAERFVTFPLQLLEFFSQSPFLIVCQYPVPNVYSPVSFTHLYSKAINCGTACTKLEPRHAIGLAIFCMLLGSIQYPTRIKIVKENTLLHYE